MLHDSLNSNGLCVSLTIFFRENRSYSLLKNAMVISHHHWPHVHISPGELLKIISHLFIFQYVCIYTPIAKFCSCVSPSHYCLFVSLTSVFIPVHLSHRHFVDVHLSHLWCILPFLYHTYSFLLFVNQPAQKNYEEDNKDNNKDKQRGWRRGWWWGHQGRRPRRWSRGHRLSSGAMAMTAMMQLHDSNSNGMTK